MPLHLSQQQPVTQPAVALGHADLCHISGFTFVQPYRGPASLVVDCQAGLRDAEHPTEVRWVRTWSVRIEGARLQALAGTSVMAGRSLSDEIKAVLYATLVEMGEFPPGSVV